MKEFWRRGVIMKELRHKMRLKEVRPFMSEKRHIHAFVSGRVQGVGFRHYTSRCAEGYGLVGEVRNLADGRVEIIAEGEEAKLKKFLEDIKRGPSMSHVADVNVNWAPAYGYYRNFSVSF